MWALRLEDLGLDTGFATIAQPYSTSGFPVQHDISERKAWSTGPGSSVVRIGLSYCGVFVMVTVAVGGVVVAVAVAAVGDATVGEGGVLVLVAVAAGAELPAR